jgi:hypothetical protein
VIPTARRLRRQGRDRGAVLIELAFVAPILIFFAMGIVEFGGAWQFNTKLQVATRSGARVGSNLGTDPSADYQTLLTVKSALSSGDYSRVDRVVIYSATATDGSVPTACKTASVVGVCNSYAGSLLTSGSLVQTNFGTAAGCGGKLDASWCPLSRNDNPSAPDYLGVWIQYQYPFVTKVFPGNGITMTRSTVMRIEPG